MLKKTVCISNPAMLKKKDNQLCIEQNEEVSTVPIEDIGVLLLDHHQIMITQACMVAILDNNAVIVNCDFSHHPNGIMAGVEGNSLHAEILRSQVEASAPLRKQLWQQTIKAKILNQAAMLESIKIDAEPLRHFAAKTRSGDPDNFEARAASFYWKQVFPEEYDFVRERFGFPPNNLLNYGYAIVRAAVARGIVSSGLHPAIGIHHSNRYNAFSLADDLMEPYRPFVDALVRQIVLEGVPMDELSPSLKKRLLEVLGIDVKMGDERKPLQHAISRTTSSLAGCFAKEVRKIAYPDFYAPE